MVAIVEMARDRRLPDMPEKVGGAMMSADEARF